VLAAIAIALAAGALAGEPPAPASPEDIVAYRDSGEWAADTTRIVRRARRVLERHLDDRRPAVVLDVDDTSLSNYECLRAHGFQRSGSGCGEDGELPAIPQTLRLYRYARAHGVTVFFVTGRSETARAVTLANLRRAGYTGRRRLRMRPAGQPAPRRDGWKARVRRSIGRRGYRVVVNLGDQRSDLDGGHAVRAFKLPNPMYVIEAA
jgi:predicted secreted acid phosphatase